MRAIRCLGVLVLLFVLSACAKTPPRVREYTAFGAPQRVDIRGYDGHAMEPFISRDGRHLFFNNLNDPTVNTNLHYAVRVNDTSFEYKGVIAGANSAALDGVATADRDNTFFFVSTRSYGETFSTIYRGRFANGAVTGISLVPGISKRQAPHVMFDVEVSADGGTLYFADGVFSGGALPKAADIAIAVRQGAEFRRLNRSAELLRSVNTSALEYAPCISADGRELFFTRFAGERQGPRVYRAVRARPDAPFGEPEVVAAIRGFVEAPTFSPDERALYYHRKEGDRFVLFRVAR